MLLLNNKYIVVVVGAVDIVDNAKTRWQDWLFGILAQWIRWGWRRDPLWKNACRPVFGRSLGTLVPHGSKESAAAEFLLAFSFPKNRENERPKGFIHIIPIDVIHQKWTEKRRNCRAFYFLPPKYPQSFPPFWRLFPALPKAWRARRAYKRQSYYNIECLICKLS